MASQSGGGGGFSPNILAAFCGDLAVPAGGAGVPILVASVAKAGSAYAPVVGESLIGITLPGWYSVTIAAISQDVGEAGATYHLTEGGLMDFADGNPPEDFITGIAAHNTSVQSTGYLLFSAVNKTLQMQISNSGAVDAAFFPYYMVSYLGPA